MNIIKNILASTVVGLPLILGCESGSNLWEGTPTQIKQKDAAQLLKDYANKSGNPGTLELLEVKALVEDSLGLRQWNPSNVPLNNNIVEGISRARKVADLARKEEPTLVKQLEQHLDVIANQNWN